MSGSRYASRKFILALMFAVALIVGLFTGHVSGGEFISGVTIITGLYAAADVTQDQLSRRAPPSPEQPPLGIG